MDLSTFIVAVFCLIDDRIKDQRIRQRGPSPEISDSEVLTIEIVGEFLGTSSAHRHPHKKGIYLFFPAGTTQSGFPPSARFIAPPSPVTSRQNLWKVKERLWQEFLALAPHTTLHLGHHLRLSMPLSRLAPVCPCLQVQTLPRRSGFRQGDMLLEQTF
jgi:hypothetical protein